MPIFRLDAQEIVSRWKEMFWSGVVLLWALWLMWRAYIFSSIISGLIGGAIAVVALTVLYVAYSRARLHRAGSAPGIVEVREGEVTYFAPDETGGSIDIANLKRLDISSLPNTNSNRNWVLWAHGTSLAIPIAAQGADQLIEVFGALPGIRYDQMRAAFDSEEEGVFTIWALEKPNIDVALSSEL